MTRIHLRALVGGVLLASSAAATAQKPPEPNQPPSRGSTYEMRHPNAAKFEREYNSKVLLSGENKELETYAFARSVAACVAKSAKGKAGNLIGGAMTSDANYEGLTRALTVKQRGCVTQQAAVPIGLVSGALAEELLRMENPTLQDRSSPAQTAAARAFYAASGGVTMDSLGRCLAVHSPGLAYRVLRTGAGSTDETREMAGLFARTPECGVIAPPKDIPAFEQRSSVASGLYHWVHKG